MKVTICDQCHEKIDKTVIFLDGFRIEVEDKLRYQVSEHEFCSVYCMNQYIYNGLKGRGLDEYIKI